MDRRDEEPIETTERRSRGSALRLAGAGLASVLAFAVPLDGSAGVSAGGPVLPAPAELPNLTILPDGWPGALPELRNARQADIWALVSAACRRHGIPDEAVTMYHVLWEESSFRPQVSSSCGRYHGISQFTLSTFRESVGKMRREKLIWGDEAWSPFDPVQAIEVMAFLWSRGSHEKWGPYRRVARRLAPSAASASLN
jgi:hypothetical protein